MKRTKRTIPGLVVLAVSAVPGAGCGEEVDLTAQPPVFPSAVVSAGKTTYTASFTISGRLPEDAEDVYLTIEYRPPGSTAFTFCDNAQVQRAKAALAEPVTYVFQPNHGPGTYQFRAIVDAGGLIDESNEENNVSPPTAITVR
jgi:hypothetical protein